MGHRSTITSQRDASKVTGHVKTAPVPSTAAQLVEQHSHSIARNQPQSQVAFSQLLIELRECPTAIDADVQSNYKLISVVAEAGLDLLTKDDPFLHQPTIDTAQVVACLDVIAIAVKRSPDVMFSTGEKGGEVGSELCLWILPKIFYLLNYKDNIISSQAQNLLAVILTSLSGSNKRRGNFTRLMKLYQVCTDDLLFVLDSITKSKSADRSLDVTLLSSEARSVVTMTGQQPVALRRSSQVRVLQVEHAFAIALALLGAIAQVAVGSSLTLDLSPFPDSNLQMWIIRSTMRLYGSLSYFVLYLGREYFHLSKTIMELMNNFTTRFVERNASSTILERSGNLHIFALAMYLPFPQFLTDEQSGSQISVSLTLTNRLIDASTSLWEQARTKLSPILWKLNSDPIESGTISVELQNALGLLIDRLESVQSAGGIPPCNKSTFQASLVNCITNAQQDSVVELRPKKRTKLNSYSGTVPPATCSKLLQNLRSIVNWQEPDLSGLGEIMKSLFPTLEGSNKIALINTLISLACAGSVTSTVDAHKMDTMCEICQGNIVQQSSSNKEEFTTNQWVWLYNIIAALIECPDLQSSDEYRVMTMIAVKTIIIHTRVASQRDLTVSTIGKWCLQAFRSTSREIRVVAATTIPAFLFADGMGMVLCRQNRVYALNFLRQLSEVGEVKFHEISIIAHGQIALICDEEEKYIVLIRLVEYLGHTNTFICGLAYLELKSLAQAASLTPQDLLGPFWRTIGISVVKDLFTRPQKVQQLAELLGISVNQFLTSTEADTLPYLVLWRKADLLHRLASIDEKGSIWNICMHKQNLPGILSLLLVQQSSHVEHAISDRLQQLSVEFRDVDVANLLKSDVLSIACEVLKRAGDMEGQSKTDALEAFREFTIIIERKSKNPPTQVKLISAFFDKHALGMMASFSEVIESPNESILSKRRCLRAIEQMLDVAQSNIRIALPQIRACLQSALEIDALCDQAFVSWSVLLKVLPAEEDLEGLINHTFTVIVQHWESFAPLTQQRAYDLVTNLFNNYGRFILNAVLLLPSLRSIPLMSKFETQLSKGRNEVETSRRLSAFRDRCRDENSALVLQALRELALYLPNVQDWIHISAVGERPSPTISVLERSLLDTCIRFNEDQGEILELCGKCLGIIGCLDANRIEANREKTEKVVMLSNFGQASEAIDFVSFFLDTIMVNAFHSVTNPRAQGFLAYVMQELLKFCGFNQEITLPNQLRASQISSSHHRWGQMSESARNTLMPFLSSSYILKARTSKLHSNQLHPIFSVDLNHGDWLRTLVLNLLQRPKGDNAKMIFTVLSRIVRGYDVSIASFLLPFAITNVIIGGTTSEVQDITRELLIVLQCSTKGLHTDTINNIKLCSQNIFEILDYLSKWLQEKKKLVTTARNVTSRAANKKQELEDETDLAQIECVESVLSSIPADIISKRAVECGSYARALFHWEQYIRQQREQAEIVQVEKSQSNKHQVDKKQLEKQFVGCQHNFPNSEPLYQHLHEIYSQIDEPDGLAGISNYLQVLSPDQQISEFRDAGKWTAAQTWYELRLQSEPSKLDLQLNLLECLQHAGQYNMVLDRAKSQDESLLADNRILCIAVEAAWCAERWDDLKQLLLKAGTPNSSDFSVGIGLAIQAMREHDDHRFSNIVSKLRSSISKSLSAASADSLQASHDQLLKLHALYELEILGGFDESVTEDHVSLQTCLNQRLEVIGASLSDKQYLLNVRRAAMQVSKLEFQNQDMAALWIQSAKLARKANQTDIAYDAILHASQLGDESAKMEQARLLWKEGKHRKAIQNLESAIASNGFMSQSGVINSAPMKVNNVAAHGVENGRNKDQNLLVARAHLLLAKWLDMAGQTQSSIIKQKYQYAVNAYYRWEKGSYHLGKFFNKLLDTEKALPASKQSYGYLCGDAAKLVIENYLKSMMYGCKYLFQTLPKILTLWLDFGIEVRCELSKDIPDEIRRTATEARPKLLIKINNFIRKHYGRIPPYFFYTALAQMVTRISHPEQDVYNLLNQLIVTVVGAFPQQGLWPLLALMKSSSTDRASRGISLLNKVKENGKSIRNEGQSIDPRNLVSQGQKLSDQLLRACEVDLKGSASTVSLTKDLGFSGKVVPYGLVVPLEKTLTTSLPTTTDGKHHKAFPATRDAITISSFMDEVLVLNSLQRPRKLTVRGSDGRKYGILIKPKDDLRKDQRLMEFNTFVNRSLRKDADSSKRRLYIKTYAVTPLNEECGLIEWVDGLKPLRDIIGTLYKSKNIKVDYNLLKQLLDEACATADGHRIFSHQILSMYKPVLHEWFTEHFPEPDSWFAARLRYTRSCAVTSVLGYALGLGDRHGENVLLEEKDGGVFHVDFNCLFEKGLTFDKPEKIPFRLTHNMVDAFGAYGVEGPFRCSAECAMKVMRSNEDALLTILETFVYDPTADFMGPGPRRKKVGVPETPKEMLESVKSKMRGLMSGDSVPLSVEGHVDALIRQATDPANLCAMYIGWCPFL